MRKKSHRPFKDEKVQQMKEERRKHKTQRGDKKRDPHPSVKKTSIAPLSKCNLNNKFESVSKSVSPHAKHVGYRQTQQSQRIPLQSCSIQEDKYKGADNFSNSFTSSRMNDRSLQPYKNIQNQELSKTVNAAVANNSLIEEDNKVLRFDNNTLTSLQEHIKSNDANPYIEMNRGSNHIIDRYSKNTNYESAKINSRGKVISPLGVIQHDQRKLTSQNPNRVEKKMYLKHVPNNKSNRVMPQNNSRNFDLNNKAYSSSVGEGSLINQSRDPNQRSRVTADQIKMDDFTAIRKNIQYGKRPDLRQITKNIKPMSLRKQSAGTNLLKQAIDIHTIKTIANTSISMNSKNKIQNYGPKTNRQNQSHIALEIYNQRNQVENNSQLNKVMETNSSNNQKKSSKESILEYSRQNITHDMTFQQPPEVQARIELEAEQELNKISSRLKDKIKEKKSKEKILQDSIIQDKINQLLKNNKLTKKDKNQLHFLKKLEQRLAAKTGIEDLNILSQFTKKRNRFQTVDTMNKLSNQQNPTRVSLKQNLIYNEINKPNELLNHYRSKPKSQQKKHNEQLSNIIQQKQLYGKDFPNTKNPTGRNVFSNQKQSSHSNQGKFRSQSTRRGLAANQQHPSRIINDIAKLNNSDINVAREHDTEIATSVRNPMSQCISATLSTPHDCYNKKTFQMFSKTAHNHNTSQAKSPIDISRISSMNDVSMQEGITPDLNQSVEHDQDDDQ